MTKCQCRDGIYVEITYTLGGLGFDDSYCGRCGFRWTRPKPPWAPAFLEQLHDIAGTSTDPNEAILRDIGRHAFGLVYPVEA